MRFSTLAKDSHPQQLHPMNSVSFRLPTYRNDNQVSQLSTVGQIRTSALSALGMHLQEHARRFFAELRSSRFRSPGYKVCNYIRHQNEDMLGSYPWRRSQSRGVGNPALGIWATRKDIVRPHGRRAGTSRVYMKFVNDRDSAQEIRHAVKSKAFFVLNFFPIGQTVSSRPQESIPRQEKYLRTRN